MGNTILLPQTVLNDMFPFGRKFLNAQWWSTDRKNLWLLLTTQYQHKVQATYMVTRGQNKAAETMATNVLLNLAKLFEISANAIENPLGAVPDV